MSRSGARYVLSIVAVLFALGPVQADDTAKTPIEQIDRLQRVIDLLTLDLFTSADEMPTPDLTILATGGQWAWSYEYILSDETPLDTSELVVPVDQLVQLNVTSSDVIHEFTIPAFGIKLDGVPGMLSSTWFQPMRIGTYFGQCSPLCGDGFADMVISVKVFSGEDFEQWKVDQGR